MSSHKDDDPKSKDIPDVVVDSVSRKRYIKGRFLGKVEDHLLLLFFFTSLKPLSDGAHLGYCSFAFDACGLTQLSILPYHGFLVVTRREFKGLDYA